MKTTNQRWRMNPWPEQPSPYQRTPREEQPPRGASPLSVVVADDSDLVRAHLVALLSALDSVDVVGQAEDTPQLLGLVEALRPDVVVLDISMPGGNGIGALQRIKQAYPSTHVIMLTNHSNEFYRKKCMGAGASFFFDKTCEFEKVGEVLGRMTR